MNATTALTHIVNPDASVHDLMNGANEWLSYAQRLTGLVAELIDDADEPHGKEVVKLFVVVDALLQRSLDCVAQAHTTMVREQLYSATSTRVAS